jgi:hypothetical protein
MIFVKVVHYQLRYKEQQMKGRLGDTVLTLQKEHVAVDNGRCPENHALMLSFSLGKSGN